MSQRALNALLYLSCKFTGKVKERLELYSRWETSELVMQLQPRKYVQLSLQSLKLLSAFKEHKSALCQFFTHTFIFHSFFWFSWFLCSNFSVISDLVTPTCMQSHLTCLYSAHSPASTSQISPSSVYSPSLPSFICQFFLAFLFAR